MPSQNEEALLWGQLAQAQAQAQLQGISANQASAQLSQASLANAMGAQGNWAQTQLQNNLTAAQQVALAEQAIAAQNRLAQQWTSQTQQQWGLDRLSSVLKLDPAPWKKDSDHLGPEPPPGPTCWERLMEEDMYDYVVVHEWDSV